MAQDILSQKVVPQGKTPVTVLVKYAFSIHTFEKAVEEKFPQLDLIQVGNYTSDRGLTEYARRMEHDDLTDIVLTWPLEIGEQYWQDRLLDLSGMPFTNKYNVSMLNKIARDGKLYYLPGPAQIRGIVYNKTLFAEKGWEVPHSFDEFVALCKEIEASGMRSLQLGFGNAEVLDTAFVGYGYQQCFSTPQDAHWLAQYDAGQGNFGEQFGPALNTFQIMIDAGIWQPKDLEITYADREKMLFNRACAMVEDSVLMARMGYQYNGCTDEFALMPFFNPGEHGDWARLYMVCYIGLNKHLAEPENKETYELVQQVMEYISTEEGQLALMADTGAMYSSVKGVSAPDVPEIAAMHKTLDEGRCAIFPELKNAQSALREALAGILTGKLSPMDAGHSVDKQNRTPSAQKTDPVVGSATEAFTILETGNLVADAMRLRAYADVGLFLDNGKDGRYNGKGISGRLYAGEITEADLVRILPDLKHGERGVLQSVTMSGADLIQTLEHSIAVDNDSRGWFYYFSGLRMEYALTAEPGKRIRKLTDLEGKELDPLKLYTVAVMDQTVPEEYVQAISDSDMTIQRMLKEYIHNLGTISPSKDGRFMVVY